MPTRTQTTETSGFAAPIKTFRSRFGFELELESR
jgi:hypothetical protein